LNAFLRKKQYKYARRRRKGRGEQKLQVKMTFKFPSSKCMQSEKKFLKDGEVIAVNRRIEKILRFAQIVQSSGTERK